MRTAAALFIALLSCLLFLPSVEYDFLETLDDTAYVVRNPMVLEPFTVESLRRAFTQTYAASYQPLLWISFMVDYKLFGLDPMGYHLENILWHALNGALLFVLLRNTTGSFWRSLLVAMFFALHPMRAESVAWITERKDVLSGFFLLITLLLYVRWAKCRQYSIYAALCFTFTLSLLVKPMAVTLPVLLLLLDYWPLRRWSADSISHWREKRFLLYEKLPLLLIAVVICGVTLLAAKNEAATVSYERIPFAARVLNASVSVSQYVRKTLLPYDLCPFYPHPIWWPWSTALIAVVFTILCSLLALYFWRRAPYVFSGWFFFLFSLAPVIGFVQAGTVAMADRFTYVPSFGLGWALVWGITGLVKNAAKPAIAVGAAVALSSYAWATWQYLPVWRNSGTAYERAAALTNENYVAHLNVSVWHLERADYQKALPHLFALVKLRPQDPGRFLNLGIALAGVGNDRSAYVMLEKAISLGEKSGNAFLHKGILLERAGRPDLAEPEFASAFKTNPSNMLFLERYVLNLYANKKLGEASAVLEQALQNPASRHPDVRPRLEKLRTALLKEASTGKAENKEYPQGKPGMPSSE